MLRVQVDYLSQVVNELHWSREQGGSPDIDASSKAV